MSFVSKLLHILQRRKPVPNQWVDLLVLGVLLIHLKVEFGFGDGEGTVDDATGPNQLAGGGESHGAWKEEQ